MVHLKEHGATGRFRLHLHLHLGYDREGLNSPRRFWCGRGDGGEQVVDWLIDQDGDKPGAQAHVKDDVVHSEGKDVARIVEEEATHSVELLVGSVSPDPHINTREGGAARERIKREAKHTLLNLGRHRDRTRPCHVRRRLPSLSRSPSGVLR